MEGKGRGTAPDYETEAVGDGSLEAYRDFVVEGEIYQALDLSRRLLQLDGDHARRAGAAQLVLERLRSNRDDSGDHANALLRVLANYATPTKDLTEELLSLLFFSEHRVQIIHHLSKLTYQSRECVWLVVDAYIELLSSDRSLLVPILGSLADLPLIAADKSRVIDATESLLDAASEEDVPAVVQSLLSMLVPVAAPRIIAKIRGQCNRLLASSTLSLTFEVIMRHAVAGSGALTAFLRAIRQSDALTPFDVIFLALLLSRPSENNVAVRVVASLATRGILNRHVVQETLKSLRDQTWHEALRCCIRLASALLTACFNAYRSSGVSSTVQCAVDVLGYLVLYRTIAQEEALSLMMSMVSQPQRLLLSTSKKRFISTSQSLCWDVAHSIAAQLAHIAKTQPASLSPYTHIFLDHLYGIAASSNQPTSQGSGDDTSSRYPASILASLCGTMVALTKFEPGMVSLLMITIQKQLVVPIQAAPSGITTINRSQASAAVQLKQLMAVFLAGEMLVQGVGEKQDRSSLLGWMQKLLASAAMSDETTTHVVRLLGSKNIMSSLSTADRETTANLLSVVLARIGFEMKSQKSVDSRLQSTPTQQIEVEYLPGLSEQGTSWVATSLVFDAITYVRTARLGEEPVGWRTLFDSELSSSIARSVEISILAKSELLPVLMEAFWRLPSKLSTESDTQDDRAYVCSFALPSVSEDTFGENLSSTLWCYACALQLAVGSTNSLSIKQQTRATDGKLGAKSMSETVRQRKRLLNRVQVCWTLHKRLRALLDEASSRLNRMTAEHGQRDAPSLAWLKLQIGIIEKQLTDSAIWESSSWVRLSLCSLGERLSLQAVSAVFEGLWKQQASTIESGLEIELFRAFPARLRIQAGDGELCTDQPHKHLGFEAMEALVSTQDGRRTLKYLARRVFDYCELLASLGEDNVNASDDQDPDAHHTRHWVLTGVQTLCTALQSIIEMCRTRQLQRAVLGLGEPDEVWEDTVLELFAKGASDMRIRRIGNKRSTSWSTSCEIIFRSLATALVQSKDGEVACELMGVLLSLTGHTRRTVELSQLCLSLLHCPYPSTNKFPSSTAVKAIRKLPVLDPATSTAITDLLRPMPRKFHHLSLFIIGAWAIPSTVSTGLNHVSYLLECADALVSSSITKAGRGSKADTMRHRQLDEKKAVLGEPDGEDDIDGWIARDGEHRVLKNLTHDTLPVFVESILACLATAPLRAIPSPATDLRSDTNPFFDLIGVIAAVSKCLQAFVAAEMNGFNLPQRTSITVLRSGPAISRNVEQAITACVEWREEGVDGKSRSHGGSFGDLQYLFEAANGAVTTIEDVAISFQERVVVTMQKKAQPQASRMGDEDDGKRNNSGRWVNELIHKTYRSQFQRRKALSKSEAKLLPYFTHSAERLKAFVIEIAGKYGCELAPEESADSLSRSLRSIRLGDDQLDAVLALLAPGDSVVDVDALDNDPTLELTWSRLNPAEEDEQTLEENSEDQSDDDEVGDGEGGFEDEGQLSQHSDPPQLQNDTRLGTKRTEGRVHTLIPQKKRVKSS